MQKRKTNGQYAKIKVYDKPASTPLQIVNSLLKFMFVTLSLCLALGIGLLAHDTVTTYNEALSKAALYDNSVGKVATYLPAKAVIPSKKPIPNY